MQSGTFMSCANIVNHDGQSDESEVPVTSKVSLEGFLAFASAD